jgi:hypothetical protein
MARISAVVRRVAGELLEDEEAAAVLSDAEGCGGRCNDGAAAVSALPVWSSPLWVRLSRWPLVLVEDRMAARAAEAGSGAEALAVE